MRWTLEVVCVPVRDVERPKASYTDQLGLRPDYDTGTATGQARAMRLTPHRSGCSIRIGTGITSTPPGSLDGLQLVVADLPAAHRGLATRGVDVGEIQVYGPDGASPPRRRRPGQRRLLLLRRFRRQPLGHAADQLAPAVTAPPSVLPWAHSGLLHLQAIRSPPPVHGHRRGLTVARTSATCSMTAGSVPPQGSVQVPGPSLSHRLPTTRRVALSWPARVGHC